MRKRTSERVLKARTAIRPKVDLAGSPLWRITLPCIGALFAVSYTPRIAQHPILLKSFWTAVGGLLLWLAILVWQTVRKRRVLTFDFVPLRQHYVQACLQGTVFVYWGWYWRTVYDSAVLIIAQLMFAYAFDSLLCWTRRDKWTLGFGPFPIIFSTNLFLWFKDDWFYYQFVMVAVGLLAKEFIRWHREGRLTHIFNPSAFSLGLFSLVLVLTRSSDLTWGDFIAGTLFMPPKIYVVLFLLGLIAMYFFNTTLISASAALTLLAISAAYTSYTGVYWFVDSNIPIAVFLGLHLLVTDPATSPRSRPGKAIFGIGYGLLVFITNAILAWSGSPTFYDKLLPVPIMNLLVPWIDPFGAGLSERWRRRSLGFQLSPRQLNVAFMSVWIVFFTVMNAIGQVGDTHPGRSTPFWQNACAERRVNGCRTLINFERQYCTSKSGWACNELGMHLIEGKIVRRDPLRGAQSLRMACDYGFAPACANSIQGLAYASGAEMLHEEPSVQDYLILLKEGKRVLPPMSRPEILQRACARGWRKACTEIQGLRTAR
jgi:hypothetical protein